jgi:dihydroorotate dehydrogenase
MLYSLLRPALFLIEPETAHGLALTALKALPLTGSNCADGPLATEVAGLRFPNPLGMAAGFDKDAQVPDALLGVGFGFAEVGSITPLPQSGNPRPRLFRLTEDARRHGRPGIVGINIGANKDSIDRAADYATLARLMAPLGSYLAVNVSSPNTPGLRALQDEGALAALLDAVLAACGGHKVPVFLKVAPDLEPADIDAIARIAVDKGLGALIVSNTTITRPPLNSPQAGEGGGLSGAPLRALALERLRDFRKATGGQMPLVGVGGIASADDAWERIRAGASLVQLYSAMTYAGPGIARSVTKGLERLMRRDGYTSIAEAVGTE